MVMVSESCIGGATKMSVTFVHDGLFAVVVIESVNAKAAKSIANKRGMASCVILDGIAICGQMEMVSGV